MLDQIIALQEELSRLDRQYWKENVLWTPNWWFLVGVSIIPWVVWLFLADKKRLKQILIMGAIVLILATVADDIGAEHNVWVYPYKLLPAEPRLDPVDVSLIPVCYMLVYQYFRSWKAYLAVMVVSSAAAAFLVEHLFVYLQIYVLLEWRYIYSFPIYTAIGVAAKLAADRIDRISKLAGEK